MYKRYARKRKVGAKRRGSATRKAYLAGLRAGKRIARRGRRTYRRRRY